MVLVMTVWFLPFFFFSSMSSKTQCPLPQAACTLLHVPPVAFVHPTQKLTSQGSSWLAAPLRIYRKSSHPASHFILNLEAKSVDVSANTQPTLDQGKEVRVYREDQANQPRLLSNKTSSMVQIAKIKRKNKRGESFKVSPQHR